MSQKVAQSLTPGHLSLYRNGAFVSHLPQVFSDQASSFATDVLKAVQNQHKTSFYIVHLDGGNITGLDDRL
jgi:hypothetical protein